MRDGLNRVPVPQCDAFVMTMAIAPAEQGRANIVRAIDEQDIFPFRQSPGNRIVVFHESRAIAFADIGQHTEKMMAAQAYRHAAGFTPCRRGRLP